MAQAMQLSARKSMPISLIPGIPQTAPVTTVRLTDSERFEVAMK
jgi:hypothetical protein